ncbi:hypothetical protein EVB91_075 [Rhizobium phage RHph_I1_18]|nr:hypothetical protein EVB91_075 [Rhizobium phage RHph_I1_18]
MSIQLDVEKLRENKLFVAVPMYGGQCFGSHTRSLMDLQGLCTAYQIPLHVEFLFNESLVQRARNFCAHKFMLSDYNHFVFIDSDIDFRAMDVLSLCHLQNVNENVDVLCAPYPKKAIAWEKIKAAVERGFADKEPNALENFVGDYVFNALKPGQASIADGMEVLESGTGFMAIKRSTFERFRDAYPEQYYVPDHRRMAGFDGSVEVVAYFDCVIDRGVAPQKKDKLVQLVLEGADAKTLKKKAQEIRKIEEKSSRRYLSEDYFFCQQVRAAGMHVWLAPWISLGHNGFYRFGGSLSALGAIQASPTSDDLNK